MNKEGWVIKKLGNICEILDSKRKPVTKKDRKSGIYPYYGATGIQDYVAEYIFDGTFVLVGEDGAKWGANENSAFLVKGKCWVNNHAHVLQIKDYVIDKWVIYYLNNKNLGEYITGAVIPKLNQASLRSIPIPVPPLSTQEQIVNELDTLNDIIAKKKEQLAELDTLAQATFYDMFGDPLENEKGWDIKRLEDFLEYIGDIGSNGSNEVVAKNLKMLDNEDYAIMIRTVNLSKNDFKNNLKYVSEETYNFFKKSKIFGGEIIMNKIGSAGDFWLMPNLNKPVSLGLNQLVIRTKNINILFLYNLLSTDYGKTLIKSKIRGATTKSITKSAVKELPIFNPPLLLQNQFAERIEAIEKQKELINKSIKEVQQLFDYTMDKYFN